MRTLQTVTALLLAAMLLFGCAGRQIAGSVAPEASTSAVPESRAPLIASPPAELKIPQTVNVYRFFREGRIYETQETAYSGEENLLAIIDHITEALDIAEPLPVLGISQQKGFVVIDFDESLPERFKKGQLETLLTTLVMTLRQNVVTVETVQFQLNGETGVFGETYEPAPLAFAPGDPAEFAAIWRAFLRRASDRNAICSGCIGRTDQAD